MTGRNVITDNTLASFQTLDLRLICLLLPMHHNCNVASSAVSYYQVLCRFTYVFFDLILTLR